jgi:hypothetical protein
LGVGAIVVWKLVVVGGRACLSSAWAQPLAQVCGGWLFVLAARPSRTARNRPLRLMYNRTHVTRMENAWASLQQWLLEDDQLGAVALAPLVSTFETGGLSRRWLSEWFWAQCRLAFVGSMSSRFWKHLELAQGVAQLQGALTELTESVTRWAGKAVLLTQALDLCGDVEAMQALRNMTSATVFGEERARHLLSQVRLQK